MKKQLAFPLTTAAAMVFVTMIVAPAQAQMAHSWVASNGNDSFACDRANPCATFNGAFAKTNASGEITCIDSGNFGPTPAVIITHSITINCANAIGSNSSVYVGNVGVGVTFNITTVATDTVVLKGLDLDYEGSTGGGSGFGLINFNGAGVLQLDNVKVNKISGANSGILFAPTGPARLDVSDSFITNNGTATSGAGILIKPTSGGSANVSVSHTDLKGNVNGIFVDGSGGGGAVNLVVRDSVVTGSSNVGIVLATSGPAVSALIERTTVSSSLNVGVATSGAAAIARIKDSTIYGNVTGVAAFNGSVIRSYKNNAINGNLTDGTPLTAEGLN